MRTFGLRFDVNCSILFTELPVTARAGAAAACGFEFAENVAACTEIAARTGCRRLNAPYGLRVPEVDHVARDAVALANLRLAAQAASKVGASVLVEAINSVDVPGFPIAASARALAMIK